MQISIKHDIKEVRRYLSRVERRQLPYATKEALNATAKKVHKGQVRLMRNVFDRPTPFILKSLRVYYAKKNNLTASVGFKDVYGSGGAAVENTLKPHMEGGYRKHKGFEKTLIRAGILKPSEYVVPSRALKLNKYGNISLGLIQKIISNIGAAHDKYQNTPHAIRTKRYVVGEVGGTRGIWSIQSRRWRPVLIFVRAPRYSKRLRFDELSERIARKEFMRQFAVAMQRAVATAR